MYGYPFNEYLYRKASWIRCLEKTANPLPINPLKTKRSFFKRTCIYNSVLVLIIGAFKPKEPFRDTELRCYIHAFKDYGLPFKIM